MARRAFFRACFRFGAILVGLSALRVRRASAGRLAATVGRVGEADDLVLSEMMTSCVRDATSFHGKCGAWSRSWASDLILRCPDSTVLRRDDGTAIGFMEIPPIGPASPRVTNFADREAVEAYTLQEKNRVTFRVTAAGIRDDLLSSEEAVRTFAD